MISTKQWFSGITVTLAVAAGLVLAAEAPHHPEAAPAKDAAKRVAPGSLGPNLMVNASFEGGNHAYAKADVAPFHIIKDPANARTGSWALEAKVQPAGACNLHDPLLVWPNTSYTTSVWYRGNGTLQLQILKEDLATELAHVSFTAASSWQQASVSYKTGDLNKLQIRVSETAGDGTTVYLDDLYTGLTDGHTIAFNPSDPTASEGFKLLWNDEFSDSSTIDVKNTQNDGYHWYLRQFYSLPDTTPEMFSVSDGVLTLTDSPNPFAESLHTAAPANNREGFVGTVFRNTAPLYFESRFKIRDFEKTGTTKGNPAFWTQDIKMCTGLDKDMPGHPGHAEMIENDIVEMNPAWKDWRHISGLINWAGKGLGDMSVQYPPPEIDYGQYHTYACLLVPATAANGWNGYRTIYLDGVPMISVCWIGNQTYSGVFPPTKESMGSYRFSPVDRTWGELILGTGQGGVSPLDVDYVRVYGMSDSSVRVVKGAAPAAPKPLKAMADDSEVALSWPSTAGSYDLYRGTTAGGHEKPLATGITTNSYIDKGVTNGTTYYYRVVAVNGIGASDRSDEASARPAASGPNLLADPGFEEGAAWSIEKPFAAAKVTENAHTGSGELIVTMPAGQTYMKAFAKVAVTRNTSFTSGLRAKGSGKFQVLVLDGAWTEAKPLAAITVTATDSWQRIALPPFNSGGNAVVYFVIRDSVGGGGTVCFDDCFVRSVAAEPAPDTAR